MRRLFIIRKDLNLSPGKLAAMVGHCAEGYWMHKASAAAVSAFGSNPCQTKPVKN